ncbi:hypothetical protein Bcep18194_B2881 [Burkholderia lata]|uniref:Uncharacterized protein n=1 Tax=Burkholderia lata (strain ATCC 17760 / DSM 23089 / LMG 22485 / NCIMB 9086 / R18194 / 383) TaxID=482957 RepID=Q390X4_BURL3|nr:hypothetical protein Bcep18194_B2881 [Burkholderia lata]
MADRQALPGRPHAWARDTRRRMLWLPGPECRTAQRHAPPEPSPSQSLAQQLACRASTACRHPDRRYGLWTPSPDSPRSSIACFHSVIARRFCRGDMIRNSFILPRKSLLDFSGSVAKSSNITKTFTM